ncbi:hypothetical protein BC834DRAFT_499234 [Gloeopeniophorella convolvens]|nr:hypothetical protein BC834DRAFT_499234 [Gloeopeniophorella convolvens]
MRTRSAPRVPVHSPPLPCKTIFALPHAHAHPVRHPAHSRLRSVRPVYPLLATADTALSACAERSDDRQRFGIPAASPRCIGRRRRRARAPRRAVSRCALASEQTGWDRAAPGFSTAALRRASRRTPLIGACPPRLRGADTPGAAPCLSISNSSLRRVRVRRRASRRADDARPHAPPKARGALVISARPRGERAPVGLSPPPGAARCAAAVCGYVLHRCAPIAPGVAAAAAAASVSGIHQGVMAQAQRGAVCYCRHLHAPGRCARARATGDTNVGMYPGWRRPRAPPCACAIE